MREFRKLAVLVFSLNLTLITWMDNCVANEKTELTLPLYELGAGFTATYGPDYPSSDEQRPKSLPFPYVVYRGPIFKSDRERGTRAEIISDPIHVLDFSFGGSFPAPSDSNKARQGMKDLDWILELGPRYSIRLAGNPNHHMTRLQIALRSLFTTDIRSFSDRGWIFEPQISQLIFFGTKKFWRLYAKVSTIWLDQRSANLYFEVEPKYQTAVRSAYTASSGYLGTSLEYSLTFSSSPRFKWVVGQEWLNLSNSANQQSPLFKTNQALMHFTALIWTLYESESKVLK
ncbi:MAG: MipA/OmpV family protein [Bdellovibrio sp.]